MAREFKFDIYDVVQAKADRRPLICDSQKYDGHLTVMYRFWSGTNCCYVLNSGKDDACIVCDEEPLELVEKAPEKMEEAHPEYTKESYFLGSAFLINRRLVAAEGLEKAIELFHSHPSHRLETIRSITLQDPDPALIQNGKKE